MIKQALLFTLATACVAAPALAQVMAPAEYVSTAGASDLYEIQSAKTVLETTKDAKVRSFAQMMVTQHGQSTADVKATAAQAGISAPPPMLMPLQIELLAELRAEKGAARDMAYIAQQKAAHGQALAVQRAYAMEGTAAPLKAVAAKIVPMVEHHIALLKAM